MGEITIKNDSFIVLNLQIRMIRQYWFTANMLANIFDIALNTVKNNVDFLVKWGALTMVKNFTIVQTQNNRVK